MISECEAGLLVRSAEAVESGCIVEVGSYRGQSASALAELAKVPIYAIDPHEQFKGVYGGEFGPEDRGEFYRAMLETKAYRNVRLVNLSSEVVTPGWKIPVGLLFIDGDHRAESVYHDFKCWQPHLIKGSTVIFDDVLPEGSGPYWTAGVLVSMGILTEIDSVGKMKAYRYEAD